MRHEHKLFATVSNTSFPRELQHHLVINGFLRASRWVLLWQMHRKCISSQTQRSPMSLSTHWHCAVESTPGHRFSCSLPSFPILLLFNKAGHCSGHLWLPRSAAVWIPLQADRETEQLLANSSWVLCRKGRKGEKKEKKLESEKVSCSGTETRIRENHSPLAFTSRSEGSQCALQTRTAGSLLLSRGHDTLLEKKTELHDTCGWQFSAEGFLLRSSRVWD